MQNDKYVHGNMAENTIYLLTASLRADGSSTLAKGHKWGYFPSVAGGWEVQEYASQVVVLTKDLASFSSVASIIAKLLP